MNAFICQLCKEYNLKDLSPKFLQIESTDVQVQAIGSVDCGVYLCWWAYAKFLGQEFQILNDASQFRKFMVGTFLAYMTDMGETSMLAKLE
jgi:hypothetical protein